MLYFLLNNDWSIIDLKKMTKLHSWVWSKLKKCQILKGKKIMTKKLFAMLSFALLLSMFCIINTSTAVSQDMTEPCLPDCTGDTWTPNYPDQPLWIEIQVTCSNGTSHPLRIGYRWREACNQYYDYYIEYVSGYGMYCIADANDPDWINLVLSKAIIFLLEDNPSNFPPPGNNPCEDNWRVMKGSCWRYDCIVGTGAVEPEEVLDWYPLDVWYGQYMEPCSTSECCLEKFTVCLDAQGNRVITHTGYEEPEECNPNDVPGCQPTCGSIYR